MSNGHNPRQSSVKSSMEDPHPAMDGRIGEENTKRSDYMSGERMGLGLKNIAAEASEMLMETAEDQKRAGADYVGSLAAAIRRAANEFDQQLPQAGEYIRSAATQMEIMAETFRHRDVGKMFSDVQSFARRQPTAFLGGSFLAGFVAIRFLRSSSGNVTGPSVKRQPEGSAHDGRYGSPRNDVPPHVEY